MDISILEIRNAKCLMIDREWLAGIMPTAERIINGELHTDKMEKKLQARVTMAASGNQFLMSEPGNENHGTQVESNEAYLNIIFVEGLVTRNGGACTYGSKQMRNLIMQASDDDDCKGHVLILDTPGGLATAVADFKMAIDYANSKDLWVDGVIDGACCSLGIYIGSMCNHLYYTSPSDRVGSVGTFAILDVMLIAFGFVLRLLAGGFATGIVLSHWILMMTFLLTLFLSFAKRRDDVVRMELTGEAPRKNTVRYNLTFVNQAITITGCVTLVCYIMYTVSPDIVQRTRSPYLYLTTVFVLIGLLRYLQITVVDQRSGDPTKVLLRDRFMQCVVLLWLFTYAFIIYIM